MVSSRRLEKFRRASRNLETIRIKYKSFTEIWKRFVSNTKALQKSGNDSYQIQELYRNLETIRIKYKSFTEIWKRFVSNTKALQKSGSDSYQIQELYRNLETIRNDFEDFVVRKLYA